MRNLLFDELHAAVFPGVKSLAVLVFAPRQESLDVLQGEVDVASLVSSVEQAPRILFDRCGGEVLKLAGVAPLVAEYGKRP